MLFKNKNFISFKIYQNIVDISRNKFFYLELSIEDTFEARFDLIILHAFMIFYYFKEVNYNKKSSPDKIAQDLFDYMFEDFENNLREMGFGDIAVNKKMKTFITAFYGRIAQYNKSYDNYFEKKDKSLLSETILNNIYKGKKQRSEDIDYFTNYMIYNTENFKLTSKEKNLSNNFKFTINI